MQARGIVEAHSRPLSSRAQEQGPRRLAARYRDGHGGHSVLPGNAEDARGIAGLVDRDCELLDRLRRFCDGHVDSAEVALAAVLSGTEKIGLAMASEVGREGTGHQPQSIADFGVPALRGLAAGLTYTSIRGFTGHQYGGARILLLPSAE